MSPNLPVAFDAVSTTGSVICPPPDGETIAGVVAFSVEPSGAASGDWLVAVGDAGFDVVLLQAITMASTPAAAQMSTFRIISIELRKTLDLIGETRVSLPRKSRESAK